jgi:hypothetical protein
MEEAEEDLEENMRLILQDSDAADKPSHMVEHSFACGGRTDNTGKHFPCDAVKKSFFPFKAPPLSSGDHRYFCSKCRMITRHSYKGPTGKEFLTSEKDPAT